MNSADSIPALIPEMFRTVQLVRLTLWFPLEFLEEQIHPGAMLRSSDSYVKRGYTLSTTRLAESFSEGGTIKLPNVLERHANVE